jgi:Phytanoyl-CoA dioxygenase (PhyH)
MAETAISRAPARRRVRALSWEFGPGDAAEDIRKAFRVFGFAVIRGVLERNELAAVRAELDRAFGSAHLRNVPVMCSTQLLKHEPIWQCLFKDNVVRSLRAALGPELCYQSDLDVQRNSYGQGGLQRHRGWHMDAGSETQNEYLRSAEYRFAKCGIFLQDFDNGWGGGIMLKPKSHRRFFEPNSLKRELFFLRRAFARVAISLGVDVDTLEVPTRAGDLCFFDSRLLHSSVLPSPANISKIGYDHKQDINSFWAEIPREHTKYVIYWDACNSAMVGDFLRNSVGRAETEMNGMREQPCRPATYTRTLSVRYPDDYPANFVAAATARNVGVASLDAERAAFYKQKLQSMQLLHP